jgi:hypothetical protein
LSSSYVEHHFCHEWVILILQLANDFIKSEADDNSETSPTSSDSDHEVISVKEDEDSMATLPVKEAEHVVSDDVFFSVLLLSMS